MHELPHLLYHLDLPGTDRTLPVGPTRIQGWLVAKPGWHYTDVRISQGGKISPGIHGLPRRDVAEYLKSSRPYLLAGFEIPVELPAGSHRIAFEACSITGEWEIIETLDVEARPGLPTDPVPAVVPLRAQEFGAALRVLLRRMGSGKLSAPAAAAAVVSATPRPHYLRHPHLPFRGHLDEPLAWARAEFGRIPISGWLLHENLAVKRVFATADLQAVQDLEYGRASPFVGSLYPNLPSAFRCGFEGYLDLPAQLPLPVTVRVYAELEDGTWHLGSVVRIAATDDEFAKQPLVHFSPLTFWQAWRALRQEVTASGFPFESDRAYRQEILAAWREYSVQAPRRTNASPRANSPVDRASGPREINRLHYCTHNLSHQGAPLFLLEHARYLQRETGARLTVVSAQEGPLRREFEALGATVQIIGDSALLATTTRAGVQREFSALVAKVDLSHSDLVVANTLSSYWAVHLAHRGRVPVLYYVHESTPPRNLYRGSLSPPALAMVEESLSLADRVSFLTITSQRYFGAFSDQSNYCLHPGWVDLAGIDSFRAEHSRESQRARLALVPGRKLVINIGTVCDRKGQHLFARAVDLLWHNAPTLAANADFVMVGGGETAYDRELADFLRNLDRPNLRIVPGTRDVYPHYQAADLFVCSSYEEAFPRVILEAMAFGVPIVSTCVHGIPEMARANQEALLVPPGDSAALAAALKKIVEKPAVGQQLATSARTRVAAEFDARVVLPRHLALARSVARPQA